MPTATEREIILENVGPIERLQIPVPEGGGLVVLRGRNGVGKSTALEAAEALVTGKGKLSARDRCLKGSVAGLGAEITVGRVTRHRGRDELEVVSLAGKFSVADLVDPGIQDQAAADSHRIKALVQIAGVEAGPELFAELVGGREEFDEIMGDPVPAGDLVQTAAYVKRRFESAARKRESLAEHAAGQAQAHRKGFEGLDLSREVDSVALQLALEQAIQDEARVRAEATAADKAIRNAQAARDALEDAQAEYTGPSVEDAQATVREADELKTHAQKAVEDLEAQLREARLRYERASLDCEAALKAQAHAISHADTVSRMREAVEAAANVTPVEPEALELARQKVVTARQAVEQGALVRQARLNAEQAKVDQDMADEYREDAENLRHAAGQVDRVLSDCVARAGTPLKVKEGRLVLQTKRGETYFGELSSGERWRLGLDLAIEAGGPNCVHVVPQECWEGLDPVARRELAEHVRKRGALVLTAEASEDEGLVAESVAV